MTEENRTERDSMGDMTVPANALYGASTQRAVLNFPVSGYHMPENFLQAAALLKSACATANEELGCLSAEKAEAIREVCEEIVEGSLKDQFPVDVFQTGSGTSTNMNLNEVIANRASQRAGKPIGSRAPVHPNDDCNLGQSSNDTMPTALHVSVALAIRNQLRPALDRLRKSLEFKAAGFEEIIKIGRTHLMDATPLTLGQEFSGYARQIAKADTRLDTAIDAMRECAIGGTAVGTGINTHANFGKKVTELLSEKTGLTFCETENHFEAQAARDDAVEVAGCLNTIAGSLSKIAHDIRMLGSGPRCGFSELLLPATQPGSSIMPGKVNPVMSEMMVQSAYYVQGLCSTVTHSGRDGHFELNVCIPLIAHCIHESIRILSNAVDTFTERCVDGLQANEYAIQKHLENSLMLVTALNPYIGYDKASEVAKEAYQQRKTLKEVILEKQLLDEKTLEKALDPATMV